MKELYIGLMSGTSMDGVDAVLIAMQDDEAVRTLAHVQLPFAPELRAEMLALNTAASNELHRAALVANALVQVYARAVQQLLQEQNLKPQDIRALGAHGQTVRHCPQQFDGVGYTLQLNAPALLAELTGITVAADFRSRDVAAGGQGAPLVPLFHRAVFGGQAGLNGSENLAVVNIGGIANVSLLDNRLPLAGFDTGPGNLLMDAWTQQHLGAAFDRNGDWAAQGRVEPALLAQMLSEPFFAAYMPKSTGRDLFHRVWLERHLSSFAALKPVDVQATLCELTAVTIAQALQQARNSGYAMQQAVVCGGGAFNAQLLRRLAVHTQCPVVSSDALGIAPEQVEGAAFAWLAAQCLKKRPLELAGVTGGKPRVLGAVYAA